jgi:hypothetical protein
MHMEKINHILYFQNLQKVFAKNKNQKFSKKKSKNSYTLKQLHLFPYSHSQTVFNHRFS